MALTSASAASCSPPVPQLVSAVAHGCLFAGVDGVPVDHLKRNGGTGLAGWPVDAGRVGFGIGPAVANADGEHVRVRVGATTHQDHAPTAIIRAVIHNHATCQD